ncbi:hypothetical protein ACFQPF_05540 [Fictibacillus iocasae]|uniref:Lipoprotein n=1 Tax=Fictibacillus iocasae TaxID=2715437 RepID=A0ABW2NPQ7_9BACL
MKKIFVITGITAALLLLVGGGYVYYLFNIKTVKVTDEKVNAITKSDYKVKVPKKVEKPKPATEQEIIAKYTPAFEGLEAEADSKIVQVVEVAKNEYIQKKNAGDTISYKYFALKYKSAAATLEETTDNAFYEIYNSMSDELRKNGHSNTSLQQFRDTYEAKKEAREKEILKKAMEYL